MVADVETNVAVAGDRYPPAAGTSGHALRVAPSEPSPVRHAVVADSRKSERGLAQSGGSGSRSRSGYHEARPSGVSFLVFADALMDSKSRPCSSDAARCAGRPVAAALASIEPASGIDKVAAADDVVALKDAPRLVSRQLHGDALWDGGSH